jgi:osmotically-inducible protein OsmY
MRSDSEITQAVEHEFRRDSHLDSSGIERSDVEIAIDAVTVLKLDLPYSSEPIALTVSEGWIALAGEVERTYQRQKAEDAVRKVNGIKGVINSIQTKSAVTPAHIERRIEEEFSRMQASIASASQSKQTAASLYAPANLRFWAKR